MLPWQARHQVDPGAAAALVEQGEEHVALPDGNVVIEGQLVEPVDEQPGDVATRLLAFETDPGLAAHRRRSTVSPHDQAMW